MKGSHWGTRRSCYFHTWEVAGEPDERPSSGSGEAGRSTHLLRDTKQSPKGTSTLTSPTEMKVPGRGSQHLVCNTALAAGCRPS